MDMWRSSLEEAVSDTGLPEPVQQALIARWRLDPWRDVCLGNGKDACLLRVDGRFAVDLGPCQRLPNAAFAGAS